MFSFNIQTEKKLEYLKKFHLTGEQVEKEVEMIQNMSKEMYAFFVSAFGDTPEEIEKLKSDYTHKDEELSTAKEELSAAKRECALKDQIIADLTEKLNRVEAEQN